MQIQLYSNNFSLNANDRGADTTETAMILNHP